MVRLLRRLRWPRWGMVSYGISKDVDVAVAHKELLEAAGRALHLGSPRIVITNDRGSYAINADMNYPNRVSFLVGVRHLWFRLRHGQNEH